MAADRINSIPGREEGTRDLVVEIDGIIYVIPGMDFDDWVQLREEACWNIYCPPDAVGTSQHDSLSRRHR